MPVVSYQELDLKITVGGKTFAPRTVLIINNTGERGLIQTLTINDEAEFATDPNLFQGIPVLGTTPLEVEEGELGISKLRYNVENPAATPLTFSIVAYDHIQINIGD